MKTEFIYITIIGLLSIIIVYQTFSTKLSSIRKKQTFISLLRLKRNKNLVYQTLIDNIPDYIYIKDKNSRFLFVNDSWLKSFGKGLSEKDIIGKSDYDFFQKDLADIYFRDEQNIMKSNIPIINKDEQSKTFEDKEIHLSTSKLPLINSNGKIIGVLGMSRDITRQKKIELKLQHRTEELNEANLTKDKLLSIVAHDLKNPLNTIMGFAELLIRKKESLDVSKKEKYFYAIYSSTKIVVELLENLLQWARSAGNKLTTNPEILDIYSLTCDNIKLLSSSCEEKSIALSCDIKKDTIVLADINMIKTVFRNVLSNAVKFSNTGGKIEILSYKKEKDWIFEIRDNGIGMPASIKEKLFTLDSSIIKTGTGGEIGSGLGLLLCKEFIKKNKGNIWVNSEEGKGTTISFSLPTPD